MSISGLCFLSFYLLFFSLEKFGHGRYLFITYQYTYPINYLYLYATYANYAIYDFCDQHWTDPECDDGVTWNANFLSVKKGLVIAAKILTMNSWVTRETRQTFEL